MTSSAQWRLDTSLVAGQSHLLSWDFEVRVEWWRMGNRWCTTIQGQHSCNWGSSANSGSLLLESIVLWVTIQSSVNFVKLLRPPSQHSPYSCCNTKRTFQHNDLLITQSLLYSPPTAHNSTYSPSLSVYLCLFYHDSLVSLSTKFTSMYCGNLMGKLLKHIKTGRVVRSRWSVRKREEVTINLKAWQRSLLSLCFNYLWPGNAVILHGTFIHMNKKVHKTFMAVVSTYAHSNTPLKKRTGHTSIQRNKLWAPPYSCTKESRRVGMFSFHGNDYRLYQGLPRKKL